MPTYDITIKTTVRVEQESTDMMAAMQTAMAAASAIEDEYSDGSRAHSVDSEVIGAQKL